MANPRNLPRSIIRRLDAPTPGAELAIAPDTGAGWLVTSFTALFTASAVVANRTFALTADQDGKIWFASALTATVVAGSSVRLAGYAGSSGTASGGLVAGVGLPAEGLWLPQGSTLRTITTNIDVGDQYNFVTLQFTEFPAGQGFVFRPLVTTIEQEA